MTGRDHKFMAGTPGTVQGEQSGRPELIECLFCLKWAGLLQKPWSLFMLFIFQYFLVVFTRA